MNNSRSRIRSTAALGLLLVLAGAGPASGLSQPSTGPAPASRASAYAGSGGYCTDDAGVTVVVDMSALGGDVIVRCAKGPVEAGFSGVDALTGAGFTVTGTQRYGAAFVCRIQGRPAADEALAIPGDLQYHEQCVDTPPQTAFWGYWYAPNGGPWTYSDVGAASHDAIRGGFEGWSFSLGDSEGTSPEPGVAPRRPGSTRPAPSTSPPPPSPPSPSDGGGPPSTPSTAVPSHPQPSTIAPSPAATSPDPTTAPTAPTVAAPSTSTAAGSGARDRPGGSGRHHGGPSSGPSHRPASATPTLTPATSTAMTGATTGSGATVSGELPSAPDQSAGSVRPTLVGLGVLGLLGLGAGLTAWRRSHRL